MMYPGKNSRRSLRSRPVAALLTSAMVASTHAAEVQLGFESGVVPHVLQPWDYYSNWTISESRAQNGRFSLVSDAFVGTESYLLVYTGDTEGGTISFSYYLEASCCAELVVDNDPFGVVDTVEVVDGGEIASGYELSSDGWRNVSIPVNKDSEYVLLVFSHANYSSGEGEAAARIWLDDFVVSGIIGDDDDGDLIFSSTDNCPLIANPSQTNSDSDGNGNACDEDDDNDELTDAQEALYDFLDPTFPNDANTDYDGDGLSNVKEIHLGFDPSQADAAFPVDLTDYFPLGEILWSYESEGAEGTLKSTKGHKDNVFTYSGSTTRWRTSSGEVFYHFEESATYEVREDGIYLLQLFGSADNGSGDFRIDYSFIYEGGILQIPFSANLNTTVNVQAEVQARRWENGVEEDVPDGTVYRTFDVSGGLNFDWKSSGVSTVEVRITDSEDPANTEAYPTDVFRLGNGLGRLNTLEYFPFLFESNIVDMQVTSRFGDSTSDDSTTPPTDSATDSPARETEGQGGGGGGGSLDWWLMALLGAAGLFQLRRLRHPD